MNSTTTTQDPYSYSTHRFKLCAQAKLKKNDISEHVETRNLQLINGKHNNYLIV